MQTAKLYDDQIRSRRTRDLDRDIGLHAEHISRFHCAIDVDEQIRVGALKLDQPRRNPERAETLGHCESDFA
jgi:hypothetical protein